MNLNEELAITTNLGKVFENKGTILDNRNKGALEGGNDQN